MANKKKLVTLNVVSSASQVLFIGLVYFLLYRFLLKQIGVEMLGVWSVVLSTSSLANLANFGVADSVIRFVALFAKEDDHVKIKQLIFTSVVFLGLLFIIIAAIIYPFADLILKSVLPTKYLSAGLSILPYSLCCLILNAVNGVFASVLDGMQKNYIKNITFSTSSILLLILAYLLVPRYHLLGVAMAQVCQSTIAITTCMLIVIFKLKYNPLKWNWNKQIFKQIFSYGMKFQFISLAAMLNEPVTKILLGKFGGMAFTGYYEMANRVLMQARGVIVNGTQSLIPVMINLTKELKEIQEFYKKVFSNVLFFSVSAMGILILSAHIISIYWIGSYQPIFCYTILILGLSLLINILNTPAYFFYMAEGNLNILIKNHLLLGLSNSIAGYCLGYYLGGYGVIYGWFFAVLASSVYILLVFNKMYSIKFISLFQKHDIYFSLVIITLIIFNTFFIINHNYKVNDFLYVGIILSLIGFYFLKYKANSYKLVMKKNT